MKDISETKELQAIGGGFHPAAIAIGTGVATYVGAEQIISATRGLNQFGRDLSRQIYDYRHPNPLGSMSYTASDFYLKARR